MTYVKNLEIMGNDSRNPVNFSRARKWHIVSTATFFTFNTALGSSLPSGTHNAISRYFNIHPDDISLVLINSLYIAGFAVGFLIFGPLSEYSERAALRSLDVDHAEKGCPDGILERKLSSVMKDLLLTLARPYVMTVQEPILLLTSLYLMFVYGMMYLFFQAYPVIFQELYGLSPGVAGLAFLPMTLGSLIAFLIFLKYTSFHTKALKAEKPWASIEEYRRLPLAAIGGPIPTISLFHLGWTSSPKIHPVIPSLAGIWFGTGYLLIFIAMLNYLADAYKQRSASAQAAAGSIRAMAAVCLPLATRRMYGDLGIQWASSLMGFLAVGMAVIPFVFIR